MTSALLDVLERLRIEIDPDQHAHLTFLAADDQDMAVLELLHLVDRGALTLERTEIRALRRILEDGARTD